MDIQNVSLLKDFFLQNPSFFIGLVLPPAIDLLNKDIPEEQEGKRFLVTLGFCLLITALFNLDKILVNSWGQAIGSFGVIFAESQMVYKLYFKESVLRSKILERLYSPEEPKDEPVTGVTLGGATAYTTVEVTPPSDLAAG